VAVKEQYQVKISNLKEEEEEGGGGHQDGLGKSQNTKASDTESLMLL